MDKLEVKTLASFLFPGANIHRPGPTISDVHQEVVFRAYWMYVSLDLADTDEK